MAFELGTDGPSSILVGIDGTDTSMRAFAHAVGTARRQGARLVALYVRSTSALSAQVAATAGAVAQTQDEVAHQLEGTVEQAAASGVTIEFVSRTGNPYHEILALAEERRVDGIVVGASTQAGHRLVGSLAGHLVRDAAWPVTVVP